MRTITATCSVGKTFQALLAHFLVLMAIFCHLRAMLSDPGYVPLPPTKIDFSSDLEKTETKKKRKVSWNACTVYFSMRHGQPYIDLQSEVFFFFS